MWFAMPLRASVFTAHRRFVRPSSAACAILSGWAVPSLHWPHAIGKLYSGEIKSRTNGARRAAITSLSEIFERERPRFLPHAWHTGNMSVLFSRNNAVFAYSSTARALAINDSAKSVLFKEE